MFTGLIETSGIITVIKRCDRSITIGIAPAIKGYTVSIGGSVAVNGICLTVENISGQELFFTAVDETLKCSTLNESKIGDKVNLERALQLGDRLDGHVVSGHIDGVGKIVSDEEKGNSLVRRIWIPEDLRCFMAYKGSVCIDGISLTIADTDKDSITISLIPHTLRNTTMCIKKTGDYVNIECDIFARYTYSLLRYGLTDSAITNINRKAVKSDADLLKLLQEGGY